MDIVWMWGGQEGEAHIHYALQLGILIGGGALKWIYLKSAPSFPPSSHLSSTWHNSHDKPGLVFITVPNIRSLWTAHKLLIIYIYHCQPRWKWERSGDEAIIYLPLSIAAKTEEVLWETNQEKREIGVRKVLPDIQPWNEEEDCLCYETARSLATSITTRPFCTYSDLYTLCHLHFCMLSCVRTVPTYQFQAQILISHILPSVNFWFLLSPKFRLKPFWVKFMLMKSCDFHLAVN